MSTRFVVAVFSLVAAFTTDAFAQAVFYPPAVNDPATSSGVTDQQTKSVELTRNAGGSVGLQHGSVRKQTARGHVSDLRASR